MRCLNERENATHKSEEETGAVSETEKMFEGGLGDSFGHDEYDVWPFAWL